MQLVSPVVVNNSGIYVIAFRIVAGRPVNRYPEPGLKGHWLQTKQTTGSSGINVLCTL